MFPEFLYNVLTTSAWSEEGCGMSTRPAFYSGRGAITSDLNSRSLEKIYQAILKNVGEDAASHFVQMVQDIPKLTATDFLICLERFSREWKWDKSMLSTGGVYPDDYGTAMCTVFEALCGNSDRDETPAIRNPFLWNRGIKTNQANIYGSNPNYRKKGRRRS